MIRTIKHILLTLVTVLVLHTVSGIEVIEGNRTQNVEKEWLDNYKAQYLRIEPVENNQKQNGETGILEKNKVQNLGINVAEENNTQNIATDKKLDLLKTKIQGKSFLLVHCLHIIHTDTSQLLETISDVLWTHSTAKH